RHAAALDAAFDRVPEADRVMADLSPERETARGGAPDDCRAERARPDDRADDAPRDLVREAVGRGHAHGGADRGGRPRAEPRVRCADEARPDAGGGARALTEAPNDLPTSKSPREALVDPRGLGAHSPRRARASLRLWPFG